MYNSQSCQIPSATEGSDSAAASTVSQHAQIVFCLDHKLITDSLALGLKRSDLRTESMQLHELEMMLPWLPTKRVVLVITPQKYRLLNNSIRSEFQESAVIVFLCGETKATYLQMAIKEKIQGVLTTKSPLDVITSHLIKLQQGEIEEYWSADALEFCDTTAGKKMLKENSLFRLLTPRQIEVLTLLAEGKTVKEVAQVMHLSQKSVDSHKYRIMNRLHLHDRVLLSRLAIREGLIEP